jgi:hypothetical protein
MPYLRRHGTAHNPKVGEATMLTSLNVTETRVLAFAGFACLAGAAYLHGGWIETLTATGGLLTTFAGISGYNKGSTTVSTLPKA